MPRRLLAGLVGCLVMVGCGSGVEYNTIPPEKVEAPRIVKNRKPVKKPPARPRDSKVIAVN